MPHETALPATVSDARPVALVFGFFGFVATRPRPPAGEVPLTVGPADERSADESRAHAG